MLTGMMAQGNKAPYLWGAVLNDSQLTRKTHGHWCEKQRDCDSVFTIEITQIQPQTKSCKNKCGNDREVEASNWKIDKF